MVDDAGVPPKLNESIRIMQEPCYLGLLKPIGQINTDVLVEGNLVLPLGSYFYFPFF